MRPLIAIILVCVIFVNAYSLEPAEILVIANSDIVESMDIAQYYCRQRNIPSGNILALSLGCELEDVISGVDYDKKLAEPIRKKLADPAFWDIKCLVTTYGVPFKVGPRGTIEGSSGELEKYKDALQKENEKLVELSTNESEAVTQKQKYIEQQIAMLKLKIESLEGIATNASVDSELSLVKNIGYELYRWQNNELNNKNLFAVRSTLMVSRLDGPTADIAKSIIDKSMKAEKTGLNGTAYIDSGYSKVKKGINIIDDFDKSLEKLAQIAAEKTKLKVVAEDTEKLFGENECSDTVIYCGWYSLKKYIKSCDFKDGAIGFHIASYEAVDLRDPNSTQWVPAMLKDGVTAAIGAVAEPYLHAMPKPDEFFSRLFDGDCIVEAFYKTKPFNSWQLVLIADPLYKPFKK